LIWAEFDIHVHGLGYSFVDNLVPSMNLRLQQFVLATPIDKETITLRIGLRIKEVNDPGKIHPLGLLPKSWVTWLIRRKAMDGFKNDLADDFPIWNNKAYLDPPKLAAGDGPIGWYRRWTRQFYPMGVENQQPEEMLV
jgi:hypothetical protein